MDGDDKGKRVEQRVTTVLALFHEQVYRQILVLVPNLVMQDMIFDAMAFRVKHTKIAFNRRDMKLVNPSPVATKRDAVLHVATPRFERLRGHEWDMLVEFGSIASSQALYASVRVGSDPLIIRW